MDIEYFYPNESYDTLVESAGTIIKDWNIGDYQGDAIYLIKKDDKFGFVVVGYGSCSYCDALQSCENQQEVDALRQSIINSIFWGTAEEILDYAINDHSNRWYFYADEWKTIKARLKALLKKHIDK